MEYLKLIALDVDDFYSTIYYESNYAKNDLISARKDKTRLEKDGYICLLYQMISNTIVRTYSN